MKKFYFYIISSGIVIIAIILYLTKDNNIASVDKYITVQQSPGIRPDYTDTFIPPNIAPLNFVIEESGLHYFVRIYSSAGEDITIFSKTPEIVIPIKPWKRILSANHNQKLYFDVYTKSENGEWIRYNRITNTIMDDEIDNYVVYRKMKVLYNHIKDISIYQRNIQNYKKSLILDNRSFNYGCVNCHTFHNNKTNNMLLHLRGTINGNLMLLVKNDTVKNIDSRTKYGLAPAAFTSWHPSGRMLVFSFNKVRQFFHAARMETRDGVDLDSGLALFSIDTETIIYDSKISNPEFLETFPTWSPDGRYIYFCSAARLWPADWKDVPPERYKEMKYNLMRIDYDMETGEFGELETVLSAQETGLSISEPRISPDGRFLLFCMAEYGCMPSLSPESDIYLMNLSTGNYHRLECNSERADSWHSWSSNSRWTAFSSKRSDGLFMKIYFSYIDKNGNSYKPFLLPQKNPTFYDSYFQIFQLPELVTNPIKIKKREFVEAIYSPEMIEGRKAITSATPPQTQIGDHKTITY